MSRFDYDAYASSLQIILASPGKMQQSLSQLEQDWNALRIKEETKTQALLAQIAQKKIVCIKQYNEIRSACEAVGVHVLPPEQHPMPSQLYVDDALATQNNLAKEIKSLIDIYNREQNQARQKQRAQEEERRKREEAEAKAREMAREKAAIEAKKKKEEEEKAEKEEILRKQLAIEKERQNKEELQRKLKRLIPAGIVIIVIILILILK